MEYKCLYAAEREKNNANYDIACVDVHGALVEDEYDHEIKEIATSKYIELSKQNKVKWETVFGRRSQ